MYAYLVTVANSPWSTTNRDSSAGEDLRSARIWSGVALSAPLGLLLGLTLLLGLSAAISEFDSSFWKFGLVILGWTILPILCGLLSYLHSRHRMREQQVLRAQIVALVLSFPVLLGLALLYWISAVAGII